jgi:predicted protein tyrosine phosphatase
MGTMNRLANANNRYQGDAKRVLCVCSAGLLRSPTAAWVLSNPPYNFNTRSAGIEEQFALIPVDVVLLSWAQEVVCMTEEHRLDIERAFEAVGVSKCPIKCLGIPDDYARMDPELIARIKAAYPA